MNFKKIRRKLEQNAPLTAADYQQLADHCLASLDEIAAIIPLLKEMMPAGVGTGRGRLSIPLVFLGTAIDSVEQIRALQSAKQLDVHRGRGTLQLMEAFLPVRDEMASLDRDLVNVLNTGRSSLAGEALDTYDSVSLAAPAIPTCSHVWTT